MGAASRASWLSPAEPDLEPPRRIYERGRLRIDFDAYEVWIDSHPVQLLRRDFHLLCFFVRFPNRVFNRKEILSRVWPPQTPVGPRTVDVHVYHLRKGIERNPAHPELLVTVRGVGWKFSERAL